MDKNTSTENKYPLLSTIDSPDDLRRLTVDQLPQVCQEIRRFLIDSLATNPGHFASNMGAVELTVALPTCSTPPTTVLCGTFIAICVWNLLFWISWVSTPLGEMPTARQIGQVMPVRVSLSLKRDIHIGLVPRPILTKTYHPLYQIYDIKRQPQHLALLSRMYLFMVDHMSVYPANIASEKQPKEIQANPLWHNASLYYLSHIDWLEIKLIVLIQQM